MSRKARARTNSVGRITNQAEIWGDNPSISYKPDKLIVRGDVAGSNHGIRSAPHEKLGILLGNEDYDQLARWILNNTGATATSRISYGRTDDHKRYIDHINTRYVQHKYGIHAFDIQYKA